MNTTAAPTAAPKADPRLAALWRFAIAISVLNLLGHGWFGFEQSHITPIVSLLTGYTMEILIECAEAWTQGRRVKFLGGGWKGFVEFLLPAHITSLAVAMLVYAGDRLTPVMFGTSVAIASKTILRNQIGKGSRHFMNPSNLGIAAILLAFPAVGAAPGYHFVENLGPLGDWILPCIIICSGSMLNGLFTRKIPLVIGWLVGFATQATVRHFVFDSSLTGSLMPMTGVAFLLFTFYMVSDPATTPTIPWRQALFGFSVAAAYGVLMAMHVVFAIFFALAFVCGVRGAWIAVTNLMASQAPAQEGVRGAELRPGMTRG